MKRIHPAGAGLFLLAALWAGSAGAERPGYPGIWFAADVEAQFRSLARRGDGLAFNLGAVSDENDPTLCKHLQGMVRRTGTGTPYLYVTRSGNDPGWTCITGTFREDPGNLFVVELASRDGTGERLRSNRLRRDWFPFHVDMQQASVLPWTKPPDVRDRLVTNVRFDGRGGWPAFMHPGGVQEVDGVLAIAMEKPKDFGAGLPSPSDLVQFVDVADPRNPRPLAQFPRAGSGVDQGAMGLLALTPVFNPQGPGLRYLMLTTGGKNESVRFWRSKSTTAAAIGPTDLRSPALDWEEVARYSDGELGGSCSGGEDWPTTRSGIPIAYQSITFVRQDGLLGPLYAVAAHNTGVGGDGDDYLALYRVNVDAYGTPLPGCGMELVAKRRVSSYPYGGHGDSAALSAAGGAYVSPSGELIFYATEYENDGPWEYLGPNARGTRTVRFVEWRNVNVVRPDSPTLRPSLDTARYVTVDEGAATTLAGTGRPPLTKAWIALFEDDGAGRELPGLVDDDDWLQVDYDDRAADHFDNFRRLDSTTGTDYDDNAGSWRWFAHAGCTLRANEDPVGATTGVFPGRHTRTLRGDGNVYVARDLDAIRNDADDASMDDRISGVQFDAIAPHAWGHASCDDYYAAPIGIAWNLDGDATFERLGTSIAFSAATLDGPTATVIGARAVHPTDTTELGTGPTVPVTVSVRNVAPSIAGAALTDGGGNAIGTVVPFALTGLPVTLRASFTDPGRPDRQTASIDWGDGVVTPSSQFASFSDAFGGATGRLAQAKAYATGGIRTVRLGVTDDDGGAATTALELRVVTPAEAVAEIGGLVDAVLSGAATDAQRRALEAARRALLGSTPQSANGALARLDSGQYAAADAFLRQALERLQRAAEAGADVATLTALVQQVRAALAAP